MQIARTAPRAEATPPAKAPPKPADTGQPMGQGGVYIDGGEGDDTVIMPKSAKGVYINGGPGQDTVKITDDAGVRGGNWGVAGLGPDGTLAAGGLVVAAITVTVIAWRALAPEVTKGR
jgi:hypothetical protein